MARVLIADDEEGFRRYVSKVLEKSGHEVTGVEDGAAAKKSIEKESFDLLVTDLSMPGLNGIDLVRIVREQQPDCEIIVCTAYGSVESAVEAMRLGAFDFLEKPLKSPEQMTLLASRALERRRLRTFVERTERERLPTTGVRLSYGDPAMEPVCRAVQRVAPAEATVLLLGESGTGKGVVARAIHHASSRASGPFVVLNCAALPENLVESELFGHEKGAFTGATETRRGKIELAEGGTFFLDEIGELRPEVQAKLLHVLEDGQFEHLGGSRTIRADVRWIAATHRDLKAMMSTGDFREDLYHRLAIFPISLPPLRERPGDIGPIARALMAEISGGTGSPKHLSEQALEALRLQPWKGNIRDLRNTLERAAIMADGAEIDVSDLGLEVASNGARPVHGSLSLADAERSVLLAALERAAGNRREAATLLGIGLRTMYDKLKRHGIA